jgi:pimeloyl-ACP methyl ester carboxylesterase
MKTTCRLFLTCWVILTPFSLFAQTTKSDAAVKYGENAAAGKYLNTRGFKMYYEIYGKGNPLLLIHGNGGSIISMEQQIPYFSKHYKVIVADSRAQGKSTDNKDSLTYEMMADDYNALLDSLHIDSADVIGWSDGGINGLLLAQRHPEKVKKLAVTGANLRPDTSAVDTSGFTFLNQYKSFLKNEKQDDKTKNAFKLLSLMETQPNIPVALLHKIQCPALVIAGDHDVIRPSHTVEIFENIPQAYLWILPAAGHGTCVVYKDEFNKKVHDFFIKPYRKIKWIDWE